MEHKIPYSAATATGPDRSRPGRRAGAAPTRRALLAGLGCAAAAIAAGPRIALAGHDLDRIVADRVLRFGIRTDAPPFASVREGVSEGFTVEICKRVLDSLAASGIAEGLRAEFVEVDTGNRFEMIRERKIDVLCGATTATLGRRRLVSFSLPVFATGIGAVMRADAPEEQRRILVWNTFSAFEAESLAGIFDGLRIGARSGTTAAEWLGTVGPFADIEGISRYHIDDHFAALEKVARGTLDLYFADQAILKGLVRQGGLEGLEVSRATYTYEPYALAIPRGDEDLRLLIDTALAELYRSGEILEIYERYFGPPPPEVEYFYATHALPP